MPLFFLYIKAELENVGSLQLLPDAPLCLSVQNPLSSKDDPERRDKVVISMGDYVDQEADSREPPHHLSITWAGQKKASVGRLLTADECKTALKKKKTQAPRAMTDEDSCQFVPIAALECRGLEPVGFECMGSGVFVVTSTGGVRFEADQVDLSEGDWADYDEKNDGEWRVHA
jgi:Eukaryotic protein of unknown function (DUF866)